MDDDMMVRGMADRTRETYVRAVTGLARHYHRSPEQMSDDEVQAYLLHLIRDRQRSWSTCNITVNALRFLYHTTLKRDRTTFTIPAPRQRQKLPAILSREEVEQVIAHAPNPKHRTMLLTTYAAGLRLNEVLHLRVTDIDSARMTIRVEQGKGGKDRYTVLRPRLLDALRGYWKLARRARGCFLLKRLASPWIPVRFNGPTTRRSCARGSPNRAASTGSATPLRRTCSRPVSTSTRFNASAATDTSARPRGTFN
jgi:site-specific recombinase XerD